MKRQLRPVLGRSRAVLRGRWPGRSRAGPRTRGKHAERSAARPVLQRDKRGRRVRAKHAGGPGAKRLAGCDAAKPHHRVRRKTVRAVRRILRTKRINGCVAERSAGHLRGKRKAAGRGGRHLAVGFGRPQLRSPSGEAAGMSLFSDTVSHTGYTLPLRPGEVAQLSRAGTGIRRHTGTI